MTELEAKKAEATDPTMGRPDPSIPTVDRPKDDPAALAKRRRTRRGDRFARRAHHSLYEDMLN
ncbi:hypothetical protein [Thalassococcus profundi]|uniref:hypothetical protein n=1 Tax=Thalassococcus profundi TaxID=2282382 RepID=UPI001F26F89C|nr:hypothetical protein [Thalassococcus profundi]